MESNKSLSRIAVSALPQNAMTGLPCLRASRAMPILRFHPPHAGGLDHFHDRERSVCRLCQQIPYFWRMNVLLVVARSSGACHADRNNDAVVCLLIEAEREGGLFESDIAGDRMVGDFRCLGVADVR